MIEVSDISKKYGNHYAVKNLSFSIEKGKVYGFLGPNGAGKTTTMNILTGYLAATNGKVTIDGHDILKEAEEAKKCIGYLPEIPPLYPDMTVLEYLSFVAELKKVPKDVRKAKVEEVMEKNMITDMQNRMIKNLSKGYKQRVGLAQAILGNPDVIILDEPTVGLDPKQILEIRELIAELKKEHTIILSSHILSEVSAVCDHIMIISHGQLVASDTVENLNKMMTGESHVNITVKGSRADVEEVIEDIDGVDSYQINTLEENNLCDVDIAVEKGKEIRDVLSIKLGEKKIPVYKLEMNSKSLEEIFLELTQNNENDAKNPEEKVVNETEMSEVEVREEIKEVNENDSDL